MAKTKAQLALVRGIRNNNPGNIEYNPATKWQGLDNPPTDGRFCRFKSAPYGIRAIARTLIVYYDQHGIDTIREAFNRYAPPSDKNDTAAYIAAICKDVGAAAGQKVDFHDYKILRAMVCGIIEHENGMDSYLEYYTDAQIDKAMTLAGVEAPQKPLSKTKTVQGAQVTTAGVLGAGLSDALQQAADSAPQLQPLIDYSEWIKFAFLALSLLGIGLTVWGRIRQRNQGVA